MTFQYRMDLAPTKPMVQMNKSTFDCKFHGIQEKSYSYFNGPRSATVPRLIQVCFGYRQLMLSQNEVISSILRD